MDGLAPAARVPAPGPGTARRWWALAALALSGLVVGVDLTVLNVALPVLSTALGASTGRLQRFADAYNLALAALLLPAGRLGDRYGAKRLVLGALTVLAAASVACAYAGSSGELIAARAVLGATAAFLVPLPLSMLPALFPPHERRRALTVWLTANTAGIPLGPVLGGALLDSYWWGSVFLINVPLIAAALAAVAVLVPDMPPAPGRPRLDLPDAAASSAGLMLLTYGFIRAGETRWGDGATIGCLAGGAAVLAGFVARQRHLGDGDGPVDLPLFGSRAFTWGALLATAVSFAMFGVLFAMPQYFQAVGGADALGVGVRMLPVIGGLLAGSQAADRLAARAGTHAVVGAGFVLMLAGSLAGASTGTGTGYGLTAAWFVVAGVGLGFALPATMDAALGELPPGRAGAGSALVQALRQVGGTIGVAVLGTVLATGYRDRLGRGGLPSPLTRTAGRSVSTGVAAAAHLHSPVLLAQVRTAFVYGLDRMLAVCGAIAALCAVLALVFLPRHPGAAAAGGAAAAEGCDGTGADGQGAEVQR